MTAWDDEDVHKLLSVLPEKLSWQLVYEWLVRRTTPRKLDLRTTSTPPTLHSMRTVRRGQRCPRPHCHRTSDNPTHRRGEGLLHFKRREPVLAGPAHHQAAAARRVGRRRANVTHDGAPRKCQRA